MVSRLKVSLLQVARYSAGATFVPQPGPGDSMNDRPGELDPSAVALLGDSTYRESQVTYGGVTYALERSAQGDKRLVAVAEDESAFGGFAGTAQTVDGRLRFVAATRTENARGRGSALRPFAPPRFGLHASAGCGDRLGLATPSRLRALKAVRVHI